MSEQNDPQTQIQTPEEAKPASTPTALMPKLTAGRIVEYTARNASHQGLEGGVAYPAIVVRVWSDTCATLAVFTESERFPLHTIKSVSYDGDAQPGTWRWPARA